MLKSTKIIFIIIFVALLIRLLFVFQFTGRSLFGDEKGYNSIALNIVQNHEYSIETGKPTLRRMPGYPLFIAATYTLFGNNPMTVRIIQALISALTCLIIFMIGCRIRSVNTGIIGAVITCCYPFFIYYTGYLLTETLLIFFVSLIAYQSVVCNKNPSIINFIIIGLFISITGMIKPVFFIFLPFIITGFIVVKGLRIIKKMVLVALFGIVLIIPWGIRNYFKFNKFYLTQYNIGHHLLGHVYKTKKKLNEEYTDIRFETAEKTENIEKDSRYLKTAIDSLLKNPRYIFQLVFDNFLSFWSFWPHLDKLDLEQNVSNKFLIITSFLFFDMLMIFAVYGMIMSFAAWRDYIFLYLMILSTTIVYTLIHAITRYRRPIVPLLIIFASIGIEKIITYIKPLLKILRKDAEIKN